MISPRVDQLLEHVDSNYASVIVAAKRARQINSYYHNLGEGTFDEFPPPMVERPRKLPHDRSRGSRRREDEVPLPVAGEAAAALPAARAAAAGQAMARILLGVSGGIAAYKALELARLATSAGHGVRVVQTPDAATRFVGAASFAGIVGAPVLLDEFERDPLRGAFPGEPPPTTSRSGTSRWSARRRLPDRAGLGQHVAKLAAGSPTTC